MAKKPPKKMAKRDFPSDKKRDRYIRLAEAYHLSEQARAAGYENVPSNREIGIATADQGTAGLVPNKAGQKMQANKKLKTPQTGRDIPLPKSNF